MKKISFWESFFWDISQLEHQKLNEAASAVNQLSAEGADNRQSIRRLLNLDRVQAAEIEKLQMVISVLGDILVDQEVISREDLRARIETVLRENEQREESISAGPYRSKGQPTKRKPRVTKQPKVTCARCKQEVLWIHTEALEEGSVCDPCYNEE